MTNRTWSVGNICGTSVAVIADLTHREFESVKPDLVETPTRICIHVISHRLYEKLTDEVLRICLLTENYNFKNYFKDFCQMTIEVKLCTHLYPVNSHITHDYNDVCVLRHY